MATVDCSNRADKDSVEKITGAAEERIGSVLTVNRVVLLQSILQSVRRRMPRVIFCRKAGHYERTCRGRRAANRGRVRLIHDDSTDGGLLQNDPEESVSSYGSSVGWVTDSNAVTQGWNSDSSTDYVVMSVRRKQEEELKIAGAKLPLRINGHATEAWIDSASPISIFTIGEL